MARSLFVSYRREDVAAEAGRLSSEIGDAIGRGSVFIDVESIGLGERWPSRIEASLSEASTVLVVIGPEWLRTADEYGVRRIDDEEDWVRREVGAALGASKVIIPVLVAGARMPPRDKLPDALRGLVDSQAIELRRDYWSHDVKLLLSQLTGTEGISAEGSASLYPVPPPEVPDALTAERLETALRGSLRQWSSVTTPLPEDPAKDRVELYREYRFTSFRKAISFMNEVAPGCDVALHHPRWENIWRTLRVYLSTWDIGHRISDRDVQLAKYLDAAYAAFDGRVRAEDERRTRRG